MGSGGSVSAPTTTPPAAGSAGAGVVDQPDPTPNDPMSGGGAGGMPASSAAGSSGDSGFGSLDFVPDCSTEQPFALTASEACRYPLPDGVVVDLAALQVATLDGAEPSLLSPGQSSLSCLLGQEFYIDVSTTPAAVVLCTATCSALSANAQVVAIDGCVPATP
jgi:hypothetical protein